MRIAAAALLAASLSLPAAAAPAAFDVDLARELGPVRDQRDIGWCYANAVADILGWKYRTLAPVSAAHVALMRNRSIGGAADAEGGILTWAIVEYAGLNRRGLCRATALEEYVFPKLAVHHPRLASGSYKDLFALLHGLRAELARNDRASAEAAARRVLAELELPGEPSPRFVDFLASPALPAQDRADALAQWLADRLCEKGGWMPARPRLSPMFDLDAEVSIHSRAALEAAREAIGLHLPIPAVPDIRLGRIPSTVRLALSQGRPVALAYSAGFLEDASKGFSYDDMHASVIVGARCEPGRECRYKVRNSWGARCRYRNPAVQASCLPDPGHFWIGEADLLRYASSIVWFRR